MRTKVRPSRVVGGRAFPRVKVRPRAEAFDQGAVRGLAKNSRTVAATLGPTSLTRVEFFGGGGHEGVDGAELFGEGLRGALAYVADAEAEEDAVRGAASWIVRSRRGGPAAVFSPMRSRARSRSRVRR